jgi:ketosteroid isomerase-like protein
MAARRPPASIAGRSGILLSMQGSGAYGNPGSRRSEVETVQAIYDAFSRRDVEAALAFLSEDCEFYPQGTSTLTGRAEPYRGHDGVRAYFADAARVWEDLTLTAGDVRAAAGSVVVFGHVTGTARGVRVRRRVLWTWQVRDGLAVSMRVNDLGDAPG